MRVVGLASMFVAILAVALAVIVTLLAMMMRFTLDVGPLQAWRSLVIALAAAGVAIGVVALLQLTLLAARRVKSARHGVRLRFWTDVWSDVAAGGRLPPIPPAAHEGATEAAASVLEQVSGSAGERIRTLLADTGLLTRDLTIAARGMGTPRGPSTTALERLARIAAPSALPLFGRAATSRDVRTARSALLGIARVLAAQVRPEPMGDGLLVAIEDHVRTLANAVAARPFLTAAILASGEHVLWVCDALLRRDLPDAVHVAALEALGLSRRPEAIDLAAGVLRLDVDDEARAAALRTLAAIGHVPAWATSDVLAASTEPHTGTRVQAAYALVGADVDVAIPALWPMLGDPSWDVRRAAATAMSRCGPMGSAALRHAAEAHVDAFARDVAHLAGIRDLGGGYPRTFRSVHQETVA
ncbi:MAG: HEAT repeat domain-containing protein [Trueperaceae bacterium]